MILVPGGHLATKRLSPDPARVPGGGQGLRTVEKFKSLKRFTVLENESILQNINIFLARKITFFYENFRKIEQMLQKFLTFSESYFILQISIFIEHSLNAEKFPLSSII